MKRESIQHIIGIIGCLPIFFVVCFALVDNPRVFNPWGSGLESIFWIFALPALVSSVVCLTNSIIGLVLSQRNSMIDKKTT